MTVLNGTYSDRRGTEEIRMENDGQTLRTQIRGVSFEGTDFDGMVPQVATNAFCFNSLGELCDCTIEVDLPVRLRAPESVRSSFLHAAIILGVPRGRGGIELEVIRLEMREKEFRAVTSGTSGWFEEELERLAAEFPPGFSLETCFTCGLSDYSPYGHGSFGCLACFRDAKEEYRRVNSKQGIFAIWNRMTRPVQETYYCDQFEVRPKGRGYRG